MSVARLQPLVLMPRQPRSSREQVWVGVLLILAFLVTFYFLFASRFEEFDQGTLRKLSEKAADGFRELPISYLVDLLAPILIGIPAFWYARRLSKRERLFLDETGVRYKSPLPRIGHALRPDWSLKWSQLCEIRIVIPRIPVDPYFAVLEFDAGSERRRLQAVTWGPVGSTEVPAPWNADLSWRERFFSLTSLGNARDMERMMQWIEQSEIVRYAKQAGVRITSETRKSRFDSGFAIESHRHAYAAAVLVLFFLAYAVFDIAIGDETYAVEPPLVLFALAGVIAVLPVMLWLSSTGVPRLETLSLSLLLGGAFGFALYPGVLRLNQLSDPEGLQAYDYRLTEYVVFSPLDSKLPELRFPQYQHYFRRFPLGTVHQFELRKGGLGFYQVNLAPVYAKIRER